MEQNFDWAVVEAQISECGIENLRGDRDFIAFVKTQIKQRISDTRAANKAWKLRTSEISRGVELTGPSFLEIRDLYKMATSSGLMRHIFLAYGWLRFKPLSSIEPNTKVTKHDYWRIPLITPPPMQSHGAYYSSSYSPCVNGIVRTVEWLHQQYEQAKAGVTNG